MGGGPDYAHLVDGTADADSWAIDCHKWLNVPYDSGMVVVRNGEHLRNAMSVSAAYLQTGDTREPCHYTPEASRRARGIEMWAALKSLGREGLRDLIERNCRYAKIFAERLRDAGCQVLNEVELNQVLVSFGSAEGTRRAIDELAKDGTCWCGGTQWHGQTAMRISVSSWKTTEDDVERSVEAILKIAKK
jgi:glutamate/tyrosine decarboxylase-like PLP-dependent enzyme